MIDELIAGIVLFKNFILLTLAAGIIGSLLAVIGTRKFSWNGRARGVYGFLINRSDREAVCFAVSLLGFLFVLSSVIFRVEMELPHLVFLFLLAVAKAVAGGGGRVFLRDLLNSILIFVALLVGMFLSGYLRETRFDLYVAVILGFLGIFLIVYSAYFLLKDMEEQS